jgi:NAD(P)-dependent dehydrogenase (short-subunit alcohol dehydrogenase family)
MPDHDALIPGRTAVITGAASGIGRAAAERFAGLGLHVCLADVDAAALDGAAEAVRARATHGAAVLAVPTDVSDRASVEALHDKVLTRFGAVHVLMNNAGREGGGQLLPGDPARWTAILGTNLMGVVHGIQSFVPGMIAAGEPGLVISTGSKQGITTPPGDTAYNVSKAGVKVVTEALAHELRQVVSARITAHLLIPGFTFTGFTRARTSVKPDAAWTPDQVITFMLEAIGRGDFYILCPDNDVTRDMDEKRMAWAMGDVIENRPALSRWHKAYADAFARHMAGEQ